MTAIRRIAKAYLWNRIPRILHLLRADFYYGGFHNGVTPPNFQKAINATVVTNISSSLNAEYSYENVVLTQGTVTLISLPPPRFKQFPFSFTSAIYSTSPCGREHVILIWKHTFYWNKYVWTRNRLDQYDLDKVRLSYQNLIQCIGTV